MSIKDQIRAEIERQKEINKGLLDGQLREGCLYAFNQVLAFLDSLPEPTEGLEEAAEGSDFRDKLAAYMKSAAEEGGYVLSSETILKMAEEELLKRGVIQKPELVQHPAIGYMYNADAGRGEQLKQAILALLKSDLIQVAGRGFTKTALIEWVETRPAEMKEDEK